MIRTAPRASRFARWSFLLALALPSGVAGQAPDSDRMALRAGDVVQITVWRRPELSGEFRIGSDGAPLHPLYRAVSLAGLPLDEAENRIRAFLSEFEANPRFVLQPLFTIAVGGEVENPDLYTLPPGTTVSASVALAGWGTDRADLRQVLLLRDGEEIVVDVTRPHQGAAAEPVRSQDQIVVPRRSDVLRDYVVPIASITGALVSILTLAFR